MNSYRLSLGGGQQAANRTSEPFYAVWNLESHPGTILGHATCIYCQALGPGLCPDMS